MKPAASPIPFAPPEAYADLFERYGRSAIPADDSSTNQPGFKPASDKELVGAIAHVAASPKAWAQTIERAELEFLFNRSRQNWEREESLFIHVQQTVRQRYPERNRAMMLKTHAYVAGIMWIFGKRGRDVQRMDALRRAQGHPVRPHAKQRTHPVDSAHPPQRLLV